MNQSVEQMIADIVRREGSKFTNDPKDRGGPTRWGITIKTLSQWLKRAATIDEVRKLTLETAIEIYAARYFIAPRIDTLPALVQPLVFDCSVNHGPARAIKFLQAVCDDAGFPCKVDGVVGPGTRKAADAAAKSMGKWLIAALCEARRDFYAAIIAGDPSQARFKNGWENRVAEFDPPELKERLTA